MLLPSPSSTFASPCLICGRLVRLVPMNAVTYERDFDGRYSFRLPEKRSQSIRPMYGVQEPRIRHLQLDHPVLRVGTVLCASSLIRNSLAGPSRQDMTSQQAALALVSGFLRPRCPRKPWCSFAPGQSRRPLENKRSKGPRGSRKASEGVVGAIVVGDGRAQSTSIISLGSSEPQP
jgi:hypothetical protein